MILIAARPIFVVSLFVVSVARQTPPNVQSIPSIQHLPRLPIEMHERILLALPFE